MNTLTSIMKQHPELTIDGFGILLPSRYPTPEEIRETYKQRTVKLSEQEEVFALLCELFADVNKRKTINPKATSGRLKEYAKCQTRRYVHSGTVIAAALACGFKHRTIGATGITCNFDMSTGKNGVYLPRVYYPFT
jgi:hypothetical protein